MTLIDRIIRPEIRALSAYAVAHAAGMVKLDAMENPFGLPDAVRAELAAALVDVELNRYPSASADALRDALRTTMDVPAGCELMLGNGSDELIHLLLQACAKPGAAVLSPSPAFVMVQMSALFNGVRYLDVPLRDDLRLDLEAMLAVIEREQPALVFLAYPNNPTGTLYADAEIEAILRASSGLVVVDEAYQPFAQQSWMARLPEFDNLLVMRTLSKLGLAGIRLGYMAARPALINEFNKVRPPYNVNVLTQAAALVALRHKDILDQQAALLRDERAALATALAGLPDILVHPSAANFLLVRFAATADAAVASERATEIFMHLKSRGILVKNMVHSHRLLAGCLRLTIGSPDENRQLLAALRAILS